VVCVVPRSVRKKEKLLRRRLAETEERIASGERQIAEQRKLIAMLEANGRPATRAKYLLAGIELLQSCAARQPRLVTGAAQRGFK
jgi:hypothetical protein